MRFRSILLLLVALGVLGTATVACGRDGRSGRVTVVASLYPLAWAAERVGGDRVEVTDLTPPGVEAHDATLSAGRRADLQSADVVLLLGDLGFQPDVERAAVDADGIVVRVAEGLELLPSTDADMASDPHVWLDPWLMRSVVEQVEEALVAADPDGEAAYRANADGALAALRALDQAFRARLAGCAFTTFVTTHEAFGYLAAEYGLTQLGIAGLSPESEPSAARLQSVREAIQEGRAAPAVFHEDTDEGRRVAESVAADLGVLLLPLGTLESRPSPPEADYVSVMMANLESLEEGLRCKA